MSGQQLPDLFGRHFPPLAMLVRIKRLSSVVINSRISSIGIDNRTLIHHFVLSFFFCRCFFSSSRSFIHC